MHEISVKITKYKDRKYYLMYYDDPITGKRETKSTRKTSEREAEREAAKWEADLRGGRYTRDSRICWNEFRRCYEDEHLASLADNTFETASTAFNHLEALVAPKRLAALTAPVLSDFQAQLRRKGMKESSIGVQLRHVRAALSWAVDMGLLPSVPAIKMPKRAKGRKLMRGRPVTSEEFERMLGAIPQVRRKDEAVWKHYLTGLWLSGLRLEESLTLDWDDDAILSVDLSGRHPRFRIYAEAEKGHQDRLLPMTPDFAHFLLRTPSTIRQGRVFKLPGTRGQMSPKRVCRIVSAIGRRAGVVVDKSTNKFATAHDLRRAFGTRWAPRVKPATLQLLMRHRSIETTLKYYVEQDADEVAAELWREHGIDTETPVNIFVNSY